MWGRQSWHLQRVAQQRVLSPHWVADGHTGWGQEATLGGDRPGLRSRAVSQVTLWIYIPLVPKEHRQLRPPLHLCGAESVGHSPGFEARPSGLFFSVLLFAQARKNPGLRVPVMVQWKQI